ncbi:MAG: TerC family protein [Elusimicrobiaceae bacterium]|nr:TerC family protein [Elusimicrobiaceae bacterium]
MSAPLSMWIVFVAVIGLLMYVDLGILNRKSHAIGMKEAGLMVLGWVGIALCFNLLVWWRMGAEPALMFLTGYIIEYSLSMDNMFVFVMIFSYFAVPAQYQPRVLHWGIIGAVLMRLILIMAGVRLVLAFSWIIYVFGVILIYTAVKMMTHDSGSVDPGGNPVLRLFKKFMPFTAEPHGEKFFVRKGGLFATPLFATLLVVEASDLIFAVDSIPAILGITQNAFIVYSSNVFAIMGLRALYFMLAGMMDMFCYLKYGIGVILLFVGVKMLLSGVFHISTGVSLAVVVLVLLGSVLASLAHSKKNRETNA